MPSNYLTSDPIQGQIDLDDKFITDAWLVDQFVGGTLFAWGDNRFGAIGNSNTVYYSSPIQVGSLTTWKQVSGGKYHFSLAIKIDGTLWGCGYNEYGQLGNGTTSKYSSPIQVGSLTNWSQVSSGRAYASAIKTDGTLWAWGFNGYGQLGNGTRVAYSSPIQIGSLTNWKSIYSGQTTAGAIKTDGTLWMWGYNYFGQFGIGTTIDYSSPIQVGSLTNWKQIAIGWNFTSAIKTDGTLWAWGSNQAGQLGVGNTIYYSSPVQVGSLTNWKQVSCGYYATAAIKTDGTLWTWGYNFTYGGLGNNTVVNYSSPIQIGSLTNWKQVSCGNMIYTHMMAIKTDGTLWGWGYNGNGQLGDGTRSNYSSPIQIGLLTNWKQVSCGYLHTLSVTYKDIG